MAGKVGPTALCHVVLLLAACSAGSPPADLTVAQDGEPQTLDPALMTGVAEGRIAAALFEGLTRLDARTLEVRPGVAERWEVSPDERTWTFHLRVHARWSDGRPVTASDFRASWLRVLSPRTASPYAGLLFEVTGARAFQGGRAPRETVGIEALDEHTLRVRLDHPVPYFPSLAAFFTLLPVPRWAIEAHGRGWTRPENIVTNGPFLLARWAFYREILLLRNPRYWNREHVRLRSIRLLPIVDANTQFNLYETGGADLLFTVPSTVVHLLRHRPDYVHGPKLATAFVRVNVTRPPLDDARVRRALGLSVDRAAICARITRGGEVPTGSLVPDVLPGYHPAPGLALDPAAAKRVLAAAGFPGGHGLPVLALLYPENPEYAALATVLQHEWKRTLGITVRLMARERKVYYAAMRGLRYDLALGQWIGDYPDPSTFLLCFRKASGNNRTGWGSAAYERLLDAAAERRPGETPEEHARRRLDLFHRAERILVRDEVPILPLYHPVVRYLVGPRIRGFEPNVMGLTRFDDLWVEDAGDE